MDNLAMHEMMKRLYEVAESRDVIGGSNLARALGESPQTIKNWEARGISKAGLLESQRVFLCNAIWLETGKGQKNAVRLDPLAQDIMDILNAMPENLKQAALAQIRELEKLNKPK